jgi:hypothetical protein
MTGRRGRGRNQVARFLLALTLALGMAGCAGPRRNPFGQSEGPIFLTLVNNGHQPVTATLYGMGDPVGLGAFLGGETRFMEFNMEGRGEISVRVSRLNGGVSYDTFRTKAEPGDRFLLEIENDLRLIRLVRTRTP